MGPIFTKSYSVCLAIHIKIIVGNELPSSQTLAGIALKDIKMDQKGQKISQKWPPGAHFWANFHQKLISSYDHQYQLKSRR